MSVPQNLPQGLPGVLERIRDGSNVSDDTVFRDSMVDLSSSPSEPSPSISLFLREIDAETADFGVQAPSARDRMISSTHFAQERLPLVIAAGGRVVSRPKVPDNSMNFVRRVTDASALLMGGARNHIRALAVLCVFTGLGLSVWAQQMLVRDRSANVSVKRDASARPASEALKVEVVPTRVIAASGQIPKRIEGLVQGFVASQRGVEAGPAVAHHPDVPVARILAVVERFIGEGDILAARAMLEDLVAREQANGLFAMAETFDPHMLRMWGVSAVVPNVARARALYRAAQSQGIFEASGRLAALERP